MRTTHSCIRALCLSSCLFGALALFAVPTARAAYTITINQVGPDVVATGSGSLDTTDLTFVQNASRASMINGHEAQVSLGPTSSTSDIVYSHVTGPTSFGTINTNTVANSGSGPVAGISGLNGNPFIFVPSGYASGAPLATSTDSWSGQSFSSIGLTPGTYTYTWGAAPDADSLTVQIAVPEPASLSLLAIAGPMLLRRRRIA